MKLNDVDFTILLINVYFPYKQNTDEHRVQYLELLGALDDIITNNPLAKFIITGDFNYNIYDETQPMTPVIRDFIRSNDLICTHNFDSTFNAGTSFTRYCLKGGSYSLLDFILISRSLRDRVKRCYIDYDGSNPSDHFPVTMQIDVVPLVSGDGSHTGANNGMYRVPWSKIPREDLSKYRNAMEEMLDSVYVPTEILHGDVLCSCEYHVSVINHYYHSVLKVLEVADSLLPRKSPHGNRGKDFWTENLTRLTRDSVEAYNNWTDNGRPSSGPFFERKKECHYIYKSELRRRRRLMAAEKSEALNENLMEKNFLSFWKDWKKISQAKCPPVNRIEDALTEPDIASVFKSYFQGIYGCNDTGPHRNLRREFDEKIPPIFPIKTK